VSKNFYFADFYCAEKHLVIEIDGNIHESQAQYDQSRDRDLAELGLTVLRIKNDEVEKNIELVTKKIKEFCDSPPTPSLHVE
jgi:leucyl-tRNA synthetase